LVSSTGAGYLLGKVGRDDSGETKDSNLTPPEISVADTLKQKQNIIGMCVGGIGTESKLSGFARPLICAGL
jgi:hypothetical protein